MNGIDWLTDADAAFALARRSGRPLFLYWGVSWCPPCNRIKGTVFAAPAFAALAAQCVALHIDGDSGGAQALAERLGVRSYPTLVVYRPDGSELTRLPCELHPERFIAMLALALSSRLSAKEALAAALAGQAKLADDAWQLLAAYSWDTDEDRLLEGRALALIAARLHQACPVADAAQRLDWHALHAAALAGGAGIDQAGALERLQRGLADGAFVHAQMDLVTNYAIDLVRALTPAKSAARDMLVACWTAALAQLEGAAGINVADQLAALRTRERLARLHDVPTAPDAATHTRIEAALQATQERSLRHQVINTAAGVLADAGLLDAATRLLSEELARSHASYFFMHKLAALAQQRGDAAAALDWYERAWQASVGPATRLQWGASCLLALIELAPADGARIEGAAAALGAQIAGMAEACSQRNHTQLARIKAALAQWAAGGAASAALRQAVQA